MAMFLSFFITANAAVGDILSITPLAKANIPNMAL